MTASPRQRFLNKKEYVMSRAAKVLFDSFFLLILVVAAGSRMLPAQSDSNAATTDAANTQEHDGQHDFDFLIGTWKLHLKRRLHPLTGSNAWAEFDGYAVYQKVWNGRANVNEFEADSPSGHIEGLTLRTYNPQTRQWSLYWASSKDGILAVPQVGRFKNGQGEFYAQDTLEGKSIFVRYVWTKVDANSAHFEQSFSDDGGKTWEANWASDMTRTKDASEGNSEGRLDANSSTKETAERDGQHDFDFEVGSWKIHLKRRLHPLTGSNTWVDFDGTSVTRKLWGGRADIEEFETDGAGGHIEGLTLRTYNPQSHQWSLYWANSKDGLIVPAQVGEFKNGRGEFYGQDTLNGKLIYIRFIWSKTDSSMPHFEQSFSDDGGKTWEVNWITDQTRVDEAPEAER
jgi:hypothetical protein